MGLSALGETRTGVRKLGAQRSTATRGGPRPPGRVRASHCATPRAHAPCPLARTGTLWLTPGPDGVGRRALGEAGQPQGGPWASRALSWCGCTSRPGTARARCLGERPGQSGLSSGVTRPQCWLSHGVLGRPGLRADPLHPQPRPSGSSAFARVPATPFPVAALHRACWHPAWSLDPAPRETGQLLSPGRQRSGGGVRSGRGPGGPAQAPLRSGQRGGLWTSEAKGPGQFRGRSPGRRPQGGPAPGSPEGVGGPDGEPEARAGPTALASRFWPVSSCHFPLLKAD